MQPQYDSINDARERIRETFGKVELSPSSYDTAWVAMVPSKHSLNEPCFPQCLDWIIENQREDGSWGLNPSHPLLLKDSLSSTLACLLALSKWRVGDEQIKRGLGFIETYGWAVDNKDQISPLGFEIIFSTMINFAEKLNLNLPLDLDIILNLVNCKRDSTIKRLWQQKNEEIFSNVTHCAMAFRLLRMSYYDVSSDELAEFVVEEHFFATSGKYLSHVEILELHKASQLAIDQEKYDILDKINNWTRTFLEQKLLNNGFIDRMSKKEVELALRKFYTTCDRAENRRYIKSYEENNFKILKAAYRSPNINNKDLLIFSIHDFDLCQAQHREELQQLKRWFEDCRLDQLGLSEQFIYTTYLMSIAVVSDPEFSDARLMYAKYGMLLTIVDDLFDGFTSKDELLNIIELVERWDDYASVGYNSERVKVFFSVFYKSIEELATIAEIKQGRSVKNHLINLWLEVMKWMLIERLEWWTSKTIPSIAEYLYVTSITFGSRLISLTTQYYLGIKISKDILESDEIYGLWNCSGRVMRLLNDLQASKINSMEAKVELVDER
ncbi:hypothetical protein KY289_035031 [Solanum tuberosum]|nr:hypothetical protein KY289_035031 [Solanum tuberosum]